MNRNHVIKGRPIDVKKAIGKGDISKLKSMMGGVDAQNLIHSFFQGGAGSAATLHPTHNNVAMAAALGKWGGRMDNVMVRS